MLLCSRDRRAEYGFPERLAHEGCQALLALLRGEEPEMETLVPVKLVQRASS